MFTQVQALSTEVIPYFLLGYSVVFKGTVGVKTGGSRVGGPELCV